MLFFGLCHKYLYPPQKKTDFTEIQQHSLSEQCSTDCKADQIKIMFDDAPTLSESCFGRVLDFSDVFATLILSVHNMKEQGVRDLHVDKVSGNFQPSKTLGRRKSSND